MNKVKLVKKSGTTQIMIKSLKGQQLSEREVYSINNNLVNGLLHVEVIPKGGVFQLYYDVTGFISFQQFLTAPLNRASFARILQGILENLKSLQQAYFNTEYLLLDFQQVMVNPSTQRIYFIYVPLQGFEGGIALRDFLLNIIQVGTFAPGENTDYVKDYIAILNRGINISLFELEEYVKRLYGRQTAAPVQQNICPHCHAQIKPGTNYCRYCGAKITGNTGAPQQNARNTYDPLQGVQQAAVSAPTAGRASGTVPPAPAAPGSVPGSMLAAAPGPVVAPAPGVVMGTVSAAAFAPAAEGMPAAATAPAPVAAPAPAPAPVPPVVQPGEQTTVLGADPGGTTVLGSEELNTPDTPYLIRERTGEKIWLNRPAFRIGKELGSDYCVADNNAVSRKHADIITRDNRYYIVDLHSTNKTYVDGHMVPMNREVEIYSGTRLRLANEDFTFYLQTTGR